MTPRTAEELRDRLGLVAHPTCGYVAETYRAVGRIAPGGLAAPFDRGRPLGSALTFLVAPEAPVRLHRIRNDQLYLYQLGDPLEVLLLHPDGSHGEVVVGPDPAAGHRLHLVIAGGTFHTARVVAGGTWFLGSSAEWPGVEPDDVEPGDVASLCARFPTASDRLREYLPDA